MSYRDTGVQKSKGAKGAKVMYKYSMGMSLFTDGLCTGAMICELLWQLVQEVSEGNKSLQLQRFLQFVPVIGSRELEGKVAKVGIGFGGAQRNIPAGARAAMGAAMVTSELRQGGALPSKDL